MNYLVWLSEQAADDRYWMLECRTWNPLCPVPQAHEEGYAARLPTVLPLFSEMARAADGCVCARRVRDYQVPRVINHIKHVALIMRPYAPRRR
jgi:hypothetical protein